MRARVQLAIDALNYQPNLLARSLRNGRTGVITLLIPQIAVSYFGELAHEIVEHASSLGITVLIDETGGDPTRELALLTVAARSSQVDGVLLSSLGLDEHDLAQLHSTVPVVLLGERTATSVLDHVGIDNVRAAQDAVDHLIADGRTRIAALGGNNGESDSTSRLRFSGYHLALLAAGLTAGLTDDDDDLYARTDDYTPQNAGAAVDALMARALPPDAIFCFSDELAMGTLRRLHELGVRVPRDVAVIGFDDVEQSRFTIPTLTSVSPDKRAVARAALDLLLERIDGSTAPPRDIRIPHVIVPRESTAAE